MKSNKEIISYFKESRRTAENFMKKQRKENMLNMAFYSGNKKKAFPDAYDEKQLVYFNHCHPIVNAVAGFMIQHRRKPECLAAVLSEQDQQIRSEYINSVSDFFRENANFDHIESKQDLHLIMCGYGVVDTDILYDNEHGSDPEGNGEIDIERVDPNDVFWDPTASETNLLDARYVARRKTFSKDDVERLFSTKLDNLEEEELEFSEEYNINREGNYTKRRDLEYVTGTDEKMVVVHKFQWWDYEKFYRVENPIQYAEDEMQAQLIAQAIMRANEIRNEEEDENYRINLDSPFLVLDKYRFNDIMELLERVEIEPEYVEFDKRVYQTAILSGDKLLDSYKNIHQAGFTIKFKTAFRDDITGLLFGLVTLMREPAKYNTKALTEILRSLANATKTGLFIEKGATDNIKELEYNIKKENAVVHLNRGGINMIKEKQTPPMPTGYEGVAQESKGAMSETTNVTPELLGKTEQKNVAPELERQRIKQAITSLATFFDAVSLYQIEEQRLMIDYIRVIAENAPNKIVRIIGPNGTARFAPLVADKLDVEFQVKIGEAPDSATQREETAATLIGLADKFLQTGLGNIYPIVLNYLTGLKETDKIQIIEAITPKPATPDPLEIKQKENLIRMMDAETAKTEAEARKAQAETVDEIASAAERQAKTQETLQKANLSGAKAQGETLKQLQELLAPFLNQAQIQPPAQNAEPRQIERPQQTGEGI